MGVLDFAGGIVLHTSAGSAAIVSALYLGRRKDFLENHGEFAPSNLPIAAVGGALLWMGWVRAKITFAKEQRKKRAPLIPTYFSLGSMRGVRSPQAQ